MAQAQRDGYLFLRASAPHAPLAALRAQAEAAAQEQGWLSPVASAGPSAPPPQVVPGAHLAGEGWDDPSFVAFQRAVQGSDAFTTLVQARWLAELVESAAGQPMRPLGAHIVRCRLPGGSPPTTRPHQDSYYLKETPGVWVAWLPLVPISLLLGPLAVLPGSHGGGAWPPVAADGTLAVPTGSVWRTGPVAPGDAIVFAAELVHTAWDNQTPDRVRLSVDLRFAPA